VTDPLARLTEFGRALRAEGVPVGTGRIESFCRAASVLPPEDLYWAGRATLVGRRADIEVYDALFRSFFGGGPEPERRPRQPRRLALVAEDEHRELDGRREEQTPPRESALASRIELLRRKSFAACSPAELAELAALMARLRLVAPLRLTRRRRPSRTGELDLRRTVKRALRTGGDPARIVRRARRPRPRRLVLLLDVSGSMSAYSRALLVFAHAALRADPRWEVFCFGTRLTRVTRALGGSDPDEALRRATADVVDWDGGTRIGDSLKTFLDRYGHGGLARGAVVVVCSDGLDTGDPALLGEQSARLARLAHTVVWLNPLKEDPAYEPLARGMAAALPHVDLFASGHNLASLEELGARLAELRGPDRPTPPAPPRARAAPGPAPGSGGTPRSRTDR
jgi:uncharacterized protein with von Willebrand factor type A (vWA) domain